MEAESLKDYLVSHKDMLIDSILGGNERRKRELSLYIKGWVQYFKVAYMRNLLLNIDGWYRRRLRMVIWKQWKQIKTKVGRKLLRFPPTQF